MESIDIKCPKCGHLLRIPAKFQGETGQCKHCHAPILVPYVAEAVQPTPPPVPPQSTSLENLEIADTFQSVPQPPAITATPPRVEVVMVEPKKKTSPLAIGCGVLIGLWVLGTILMAIEEDKQGSSSAGYSTASLSSTSQSPAKTTEVFKEGDAIKVGYTTYQVTGSWWTNSISENPYMNQAPNASYLAVEVAVRNDDKKERMVPPFYLVDAQGTEYSTSSNQIYLDGALGILESLNPNVRTQGYILFDVPKRNDYKLKVDGGYWVNASALITLTPKEIGTY